MSLWLCLPMLYGTLTTVMYCIALGNVMSNVSLSYENQIYNFAAVNQVSRDWETKPFVALTVTNNTYCPSTHPDTVVSRPFFGTDVGCDCIGIYDPWIYDGGDSITPSLRCGFNETRVRCRDAQEIWPIQMGQLNGQRICGKRGPVNFINSVRPENTGSPYYACPAGYEPCGMSESSESEDFQQLIDNIVCVSSNEVSVEGKDALCPITDIKFVRLPSETNSNQTDATFTGEA